MFGLATVLTIRADHSSRNVGDDIENRCHGVIIYLYLLIYFFFGKFFYGHYFYVWVSHF